ncbi:hypothetical protein NDU88_005345 [Pleurodeles waltl]|uniref:Uncharacterized protein n=1 Tax=Pleurodeles waltl TaxID=8319 RepID=A0AAV7QEG1_PLEWA|nr:hypothetical protein NDU88_005345 [Pleurodeles waltl]
MSEGSGRGGPAARTTCVVEALRSACWAWRPHPAPGVQTSGQAWAEEGLAAAPVEDRRSEAVAAAAAGLGWVHGLLSPQSSQKDGVVAAQSGSGSAATP